MVPRACLLFVVLRYSRTDEEAKKVEVARVAAGSVCLVCFVCLLCLSCLSSLLDLFNLFVILSDKVYMFACLHCLQKSLINNQAQPQHRLQNFFAIYGPRKGSATAPG